MHGTPASRPWIACVPGAAPCVAALLPPPLPACRDDAPAALRHPLNHVFTLCVLGLVAVLVPHRRYDARARTVLRIAARALVVDWVRVGEAEDAFVHQLGQEVQSMRAATDAMNR